MCWLARFIIKFWVELLVGQQPAKASLNRRVQPIIITQRKDNKNEKNISTLATCQHSAAD